MFFPGAQTEPMDGYIMRHGLGGTGGGTNVNQYTLIMDMLYPEARIICGARFCKRIR